MVYQELQERIEQAKTKGELKDKAMRRRFVKVLLRNKCSQREIVDLLGVDRVTVSRDVVAVRQDLMKLYEVE